MLMKLMRTVWAFGLVCFTVFCVVAALWGVELGLSAAASVGVGRVVAVVGVLAAMVGFCAPATALLSAVTGWSGYLPRDLGSSIWTAGWFGVHAAVIVLGLSTFGLPELG
jgi:hypothetical protein